MDDNTTAIVRKGEKYMNCKKYRACLMGIIAIALVCGMLLCMRYGKENQIPADGTLVQQMNEEYGDEECA